MFVKTFFSIDLIEYHHSSVVKVLGLCTANHVFESAWVFVHIYRIKFFVLKIQNPKLHIFRLFDLYNIILHHIFYYNYVTK